MATPGLKGDDAAVVNERALTEQPDQVNTLTRERAISQTDHHGDKGVAAAKGNEALRRGEDLLIRGGIDRDRPDSRSTDPAGQLSKDAQLSKAKGVNPIGRTDRVERADHVRLAR